MPPVYQLTSEQFADKVSEFKMVLDYHLKARIEVSSKNEAALDNEYFDEHKFMAAKGDGSVWNFLQPELYCIFWYIGLQNLLVPEQLYKDEVKRIGDQAESLRS